MLEMRPSCERCNKDLPADGDGAMICSFECTFCAECVWDVLDGICPNCGGGFEPRPARPAALLPRHPASTRRVFNPDGPHHAPDARVAFSVSVGC